MNELGSLEVENRTKQRTNRRSAPFSLDYRDKSHATLPHVVKFSGGRSSGMMLLKLLENKQLNPTRGDVVIFNNTSAEHPKTYEFVKKCKEVCEKDYGVPFFIVEHCTYEDVFQGDYIRMPTFRMVNSEPFSDDNPDGYRWRGEIYEELLSWQGVVPSIFQRTCTIALKLKTTRMFLKEWFLNNSSSKRKGHFGQQSRIDKKAIYRRHRKNRGEVPEPIFLEKKGYILEQPHYRNSQSWSDYSTAYKPFNNPQLDDRILGDYLTFGFNGVEYVSLVGLRHDEEFRFQKVMMKSDSKNMDNDYSGEHVYAPLFEFRATECDVSLFWDSNDWKLGLDENAPLSNCTFCFLKGVENLRKVHDHFLTLGDPKLVNTPCDINWWAKIEENYAKDFTAEGKEVKAEVTDNLIGFFGARGGYFFKSIIDGMDDDELEDEYPNDTLPCDCTD